MKGKGSAFWIVVASLILIGKCAGNGNEGSAESTSAMETTNPNSEKENISDGPLSLDGLPIVEVGTSDVGKIIAAEGILQAFSIPVSVNGSFSDDETSSLTSFRTFFQLGPGMIDEFLWRKIYELPSPEVIQESDVDFEGLVLPYPAIPIGVDVPARNPEKTARFTVGFHADPTQIANWLKVRIDRADPERWRFCEDDKTQDSAMRIFWWNRNSEMLSIDVRPLGGGRVDVLLAVEKRVSYTGCQGSQRSTFELSIDSDHFNWRDKGLDWAWQPVGSYRNESDTTITYFEVVFTLTSLDDYSSMKFRETRNVNLRPGESIGIMTSNSFPLYVVNPDAGRIGYSLSYGMGASFSAEVRYIKFEDGTEAGSRT